MGCGAGALIQTILSSCDPESVLATDQSSDFVSHAGRNIDDERARFEVADAQQLPMQDASTDVVTSALVMNFIPDKQQALAEMGRVLHPGGLLSFYVWDYPGGGMGFIDAFWKSASELDPEAATLDESARFQLCTKQGLTALCKEAGVRDTAIAPIEVETNFPDFDALWHPLTLGSGPAPGYCKNLSDDKR